MENEESFTRLLSTLKTLRGENGCPWDKKQTPKTLKKYLIEECQELIEAIDSGETEEICDEIGDMFFILTMLSLMYEESGDFSTKDPLQRINEKMIRRHPHVFAGKAYKTEEELRIQWEKIKKEEKNSLPRPSR